MKTSLWKELRFREVSLVGIVSQLIHDRIETLDVKPGYELRLPDSRLLTSPLDFRHFKCHIFDPLVTPASLAEMLFPPHFYLLNYSLCFKVQLK